MRGVFMVYGIEVRRYRVCYRGFQGLHVPVCCCVYIYIVMHVHICAVDKRFRVLGLSGEVRV